MKELKSLELLAESFSRLPGIGVKTAERLAYAVLDMNEETAKNFADRILNVKNSIKKCPICGLYAEGECEICTSGERDHSVCIVTASAKDALCFERLGTFTGVYHVLGGLITPSKGIGPDNLSIDLLLERIDKEGIREVILATSPTLEGETTSLFLSTVLANKGVKITRLAYGLPMGASLDYADSLTLTKALEGRKSL